MGWNVCKSSHRLLHVVPLVDVALRHIGMVDQDLASRGLGATIVVRSLSLLLASKAVAVSKKLRNLVPETKKQVRV
ncbi:hypothetical protein XPA_010230 [Xanthoria parietina]